VALVGATNPFPCAQIANAAHCANCDFLSLSFAVFVPARPATKLRIAVFRWERLAAMLAFQLMDHGAGIGSMYNGLCRPHTFACSLSIGFGALKIASNSARIPFSRGHSPAFLISNAGTHCLSPLVTAPHRPNLERLGHIWHCGFFGLYRLRVFRAALVLASLRW